MPDDIAKLTRTLETGVYEPDPAPAGPGPAPADPVPAAAPPAPTAQPAPSPAPSGPDPYADDPDINAAVAGLSGKPAPGGGGGGPGHPGGAHPGAPGGGAPHHPTRFQQAGAKPAPAAAPEPELSLGQAAGQAFANLPSSAAGFGHAMAMPFLHPQQTIQGISQLAQGLGSQAAGALGVHQDPAEKAKTEAVANALESHYGQTYGSWKGFKKALATDPVSIAADAATALSGGELALGRLPGIVGKVGEIAGQAGRAIDPVQNALRIARAPGAVASWAGRGAGSVSSRTPLSVLQMATQIGKEGGPAQAAFNQWARGEGDPAQVQQLAQQKLGQIRQAASDNYVATKQGLSNAQPSYAPMDQAITDARAKYQLGGPQFQQKAGQFQQANDALDQAETMVNAYRTSPDPAHAGIDGVDNLKQALYDLADQYPKGSDASNAVTGIATGARQALVDTDSGYAGLMDQYSAAKRNLNDLTKTLGLGRDAAATGTFIKNLRALKDPNKGGSLLAQLMEGNPELRGALAGAAISPWSQHSSVWEAALGSFVPGMLAHPLAAAGAIPGAAVGWAASSPRIVGGAANLAGKLSRPAEAIGSPLAQAIGRGGYYAGRAGEQPGVDETGTVTDQGGSGGGGAPLQATPDDADALTRMAMLESATPAGRAAAAWTFINRAKGSGKSPYDEVYRRWASTPITQGKGANIDTSSPDYKKTRAMVEQALSGQLPDPTDGAVHFINPVQYRKENPGKDLPKWFKGGGPNIGGNVFIKGSWPEQAAEGGRIERADGGKVDDVGKLVDGLMSRAKLAKRSADATTKPLLKAPDESIVKALAVANEAI